MDSLPYLELLKKCLTGLDQEGIRKYEPVTEQDMGAGKRVFWKLGRRFLPENVTVAVHRPLHVPVRQHGKDEPLHAPARTGLWRLHNLEVCARQIIRDQIPGDFLETGAWRGGGSILLRGVLYAYGVSDRSVWVIDNYSDTNKGSSDFLSIKQVEQYFRNYDLLDSQVQIHTKRLSNRQWPARLALVRIADTDPKDFEASLRITYDRLEPGGYLQIDRYYTDNFCRSLIDDFRTEKDIRTPLEKVDDFGVFWRKPGVLKRKDLPESSLGLDFKIQQHQSEKQNFFHHVWGYLLPALHQYLTGGAPHLLFYSGGPYMDSVTNDLLNILEVPYSIIRDWEIIPDEIDRIALPRWEPLVFKLAASATNMVRKGGSRDSNNTASIFEHSLPDYMTSVRQFVLEKVLPVCSPSIPPGAIILLDRADENAIYRIGGLARANNYGKGHRALKGIPEAVEALTARGIPVIHYTASRHSYTQQIVDFHHCGGVVGIRGAEFAHLIWMQPGAKVCMYQPSGMHPNNIQEPLALLMGLSYRQLEVDSYYPELRIEDFAEHFGL